MSKLFSDPVTGDELNRKEYYTRQVQVVVRSVWFNLAFQLVTALAFLTHHGDTWNWFASWLAIEIEWLVGVYMFGQTGRDAIVTRTIRRLEEQNLELGQQNGRLEEQNQQLIERIELMEERILACVTPGDVP